jgi:hypothetical protein
MAATPQDRHLGMTPIQQMVAAGLESRLDVFINKDWDRKSQIDFDLGYCTMPVALNLEAKYRQARWAHVLAYELDHRWTLSLSSSARLALPEGIAQNE